MKDIKSIVSANLGALRKQKGITQAELAEKLNYSDKAISRWEKGDTLPDLNVLYEICQFYGVTMNDLTSEECTAPQKDEAKKHQSMYHMWICLLAGSSVWLFSTLWFIFNAVKEPSEFLWIAFVWALPFSCGVVMIFGRRVLNWVAYFVLGSVAVWSGIAATTLHILIYTEIGNAIWFLFILGVPLQAMLFLFQRVWKSRGIVKIHQEQNAQLEETTNIEENSDGNRSEASNQDTSNEQ